VIDALAGVAVMELVDDLAELGKFDDAISGCVRDPYSDMAIARRAHPVQRVDNSVMPHQEQMPVFMVYRHEEIIQVLADNETYSSSHIRDFFGPVLGHDIMLAKDEPQHGRHRALVAGAFLPSAVAAMEEKLIQPVANELIDKFVKRGKADLVKEFTFPFPAQIIGAKFGLPREDYPRFQEWTIELISWLFNPERGLAASASMKEYFADYLTARRKEPKDDLISTLALAEIDGDRLTDEEIFSFLRLLLPAGVETTYRATGNMLYGLLTNPEQLEAVRKDRSLVQQAIDEALRWEPPLQCITRLAKCDTELDGVKVPAGSTIMPMLGAANRDENRYDDPDKFNIFRKPQVHVTFGYGVHGCLGRNLAQLEMRVALNILLDRLPNLRLDVQGDPHIRGQVFRSPTALPVTFG
jgi:cytochrome P450